MNEQNAFTFGGFAAEEAEKLKEAARILAERTTLSVKEAASKISQAVQFIQDVLQSAVDKPLGQLEEIAEELGPLMTEHTARRRKREQSRAKRIEQRYRAEIKRAENTRIYRRIYKPP